MKNILVLCTGNSCRSQMAHGYLQLFAGNSAKIYSAGIETHGVNSLAIATMQDDGVDIAHHTSNNSNEYLTIDFDYVITVCDNAKEHCPYFSSKAKRFHHNFTDPSKVQGTPQQITEAFAQARNQIKQYCQAFVANELK